MIQIKYLVILLTWVVYSHQTDYCDKRICGGHHHIACHNPGQFAKICHTPKLINITSKLKHIILNKHNYYRNQIALGKQRRFQPASRMPTLQWNDELAKFSSLNVKQCRMKHDECRNTPVYKHCGQNLGTQPSKIHVNVAYTVNNLITAWYNEYKKTTMLDIQAFRGVNLQRIGHFTAMMQERAFEVGCAISTYTTGSANNYHLLLACDYSYTNMVGVPVYKSGRSASLCNTGRNPSYPGLCSVQENVNRKY